MWLNVTLTASSIASVKNLAAFAACMRSLSEKRTRCQGEKSCQVEGKLSQEFCCFKMPHNVLQICDVQLRDHRHLLRDPRHMPREFRRLPRTIGRLLRDLSHMIPQKNP